ncbi:hypothetical protein ACJZL1_01775 [Wolbachia endosymbiont of Rhagoletis indifferens]|uniref:hypothetical protein n=1 Tax=Wolbachia endosymbiont of Rhagoletis indifferens TaxID=3383250 RepID=UPI003AF35A6B
MQPHQKHSFSVRSATFHASLLVHKQTFLDPSGLCCIATYERLTIVRIISNLLKILFFCNQSDQI